ncbi:hypothetical protein L3Y19_gp095 [Gordonia phage Neville]|uniref:Uncharacterized protein n=1 Tax=Gordonia phage Neville TaxID=2301693 RepID=A0A385E0E7_9CAUD|nr:hypothetical protein L3Y19_gp095 [Gordonia phage Neville]AXQ64488.1 hypothetical protein SEA_NEVILLE_135 [Gordonia phage Neville]
MELYEFDHTGTDSVLTLDAERLAELTGWDLNRVYGLVGPGTVGTATVHPDDMHTWGDVFPDAANTEGQHGLFIKPDSHSAGYEIDDIAGSDVAWFADSIARVFEHWGDDKAGEILARYGRLHGLAVEIHTMTGMTHGDWLDVITVNPIGEENWILPVMRQYWEGEIYGYTVELDGPLRGQRSTDSVWGFIGDATVIDAIGEHLTNTLETFSTTVVATRQPTPYENGFALGKRQASLDYNRGKAAPGAVSVPAEYLSGTPCGVDGFGQSANDYARGYHDGWKSISGH